MSQPRHAATQGPSMVTIPRRHRVIPAVVTATVLAAAGITVVIDVIAVQTGHRALIWPYQQIADQLRASRWDATPILAVAAAITFLGLLLIAAALIPGKRTLIPLDTGDPDLVVGTSRRSLRRTLTDAALSVDGITTATARPTRRAVKVSATSQLRDPAGQRAQVTDAVNHRLEELALALPVSTRVKRKEAS